MVDVNRTTRYIDSPLNTVDPVLEGETVDTTAEIKLYEVELAAYSGASW